MSRDNALGVMRYLTCNKLLALMLPRTTDQTNALTLWGTLAFHIRLAKGKWKRQDSELDEQEKIFMWIFKKFPKSRISYIILKRYALNQECGARRLVHISLDHWDWVPRKFSSSIETRNGVVMRIGKVTLTCSTKNGIHKSSQKNECKNHPTPNKRLEERSKWMKL